MDDLAQPVVPLPMDGVIDLHTFRPRDVGELLDCFLEASLANGFRKVRIIHGKGTGALRESVHAILARDPRVAEYALAGEALGSWGATIATLRPPAGPPAA